MLVLILDVVLTGTKHNKSLPAAIRDRPVLSRSGVKLVFHFDRATVVLAVLERRAVACNKKASVMYYFAIEKIRDLKIVYLGRNELDSSLSRLRLDIIVWRRPLRTGLSFCHSEECGLCKVSTSTR